jgi:hypothetical protein
MANFVKGFEKGVIENVRVLIAVSIFAIIMFLVSYIPPISILGFNAYLIPPKFSFIIRFWFYIFVWVVIQLGIFYIYFRAYKLIRSRVVPFIKKVEDVPSRIQYWIYKR